MSKPPIKITNRAFLEALAGENWRDVPVSTGDQSWVVYRAEQILGALDVLSANYFTVSTFRPMEDGWLRRVKDHFIGQFAFVLDDVGTKLVEAELWRVIPPPTYILETSPGNMHFGFAVKNGHDARVMAALIYSIIDDPIINPSGKDPGMVGVTRVVRLPVGANCKPAVMEKNGGKPWPHVLHLWEPSRAYSVEELAEWLDVDISEPALARYRDGGSHRRATAAEVGLDPLMRLFDQRGMLLDATPNDNGFVTIRCPWAHEHSDSRDEAGYRPGSGGFQCHHGHCEGKGMKELRAWVEETFTSAERAAALAETFGPVNENDPLLRTIVAQEVARHAEKVEKEKVVALRVKVEWTCIVSMERYGRVSDNSIHTERSFNRENTSLAPYGASGAKAAAAIFLNEMNPVRCKSASYVPGQDPICVDPEDGGLIFNTWRPSGIVECPFDVTDEDIAPWLEHIDFVLPDPVARKMFLQWCAFLIQFPGRKINWAFVLIGRQGVGKDILLRPIQGILGKSNFQAVAADDLAGAYQDWAENQLIIVEELPSFHKRDVYNTLKRYTAENVPYFRVNKKFIPQYTVRNIQNWFLMSNHEDALALERDDRRYFIYETPAEKRQPVYYRAAVGIFNDPIFQSKVMAWLNAYDLSAFDPGEAPPMTDAKLRMLEETRHPVDRWLDDEFDDGGRFHGRKLFQAQEAVAAVQSEGRLSGNSVELQKINATRVGRWLRQQGWTQLKRIRGSEKLLKIWAAPKSPIALLEELSGKQLEEKYHDDEKRSTTAGAAAAADVLLNNDDKS